MSDDNFFPLNWSNATIIYVCGGPGQFVRVVKMKNATGIPSRTVHNLTKLLDVENAVNNFDSSF